MRQRFETLLTQHCSPTLAAIKPASLFTLHTTNRTQDLVRVKEYEKILHAHGLSLEILCECDRYFLIFIYRKDLLLSYLSKPEINLFLERSGYFACATLPDYIEVLKSHFQCGNSFPHEIGIFLGYPLEDVVGFIENGGEECKCCGYWKVYGDKERSLDTFKRYDDCREYFEKKRAQGSSIEDILCAYPIPA